MGQANVHMAAIKHIYYIHTQNTIQYNTIQYIIYVFAAQTNCAMNFSEFNVYSIIDELIVR